MNRQSELEGSVVASEMQLVKEKVVIRCGKHRKNGLGQKVDPRRRGQSREKKQSGKSEEEVKI